jgi:hypothetical protein
VCHTDARWPALAWGSPLGTRIGGAAPDRADPPAARLRCATMATWNVGQRDTRRKLRVCRAVSLVRASSRLSPNLGPSLIRRHALSLRLDLRRPLYVHVERGRST